MNKEVYVISNDEIGYIDECPTFTNIEDARAAAAKKCRRHSVVSVKRETLSPCQPLALYRQSEQAKQLCEKCPRFAGWV